MKKFSLILLTTFAHAAFAMEETKAINVWGVQSPIEKQPLEVYSEQEILKQVDVCVESNDKYKVALALHKCIKLSSVPEKEKQLVRRLRYLVKDAKTVDKLSNNISAIYDAIKAADTKAGKDYYTIPAVDTAVKSNTQLLKEFTAEIKSQTENLVFKNKRAQELAAQKAELEKQINDLKISIREYRNELSAKEISSKIADTSAEITLLSQKMRPLETRFSEVSTELDKTKTEISDLGEAIKAAQDKTVSLESTNKDLLTIRKPIYEKLFNETKKAAIEERDSLIDQITHLKNKPDITGEEKIANEAEIKRLELRLAKIQESAQKYLHYASILSGNYGVTDAIPYNVGKVAKKFASSVKSYLPWNGNAKDNNSATK